MPTRTFGDQVPPGGVERVVRAPAGDVRAVGLTGAVLVLVGGAELNLRVELREGIHVAHPAVCGVIISGQRVGSDALTCGRRECRKSRRAQVSVVVDARKGKAHVGVDFVHAEAGVEVRERSQRRSDLAQKHEKLDSTIFAGNVPKRRPKRCLCS